MIELSIPLPPSANHIWKNYHKSKAYKAWIVEAGWLSKRRDKIVGPWRITVLAKRPDKRRRDLDNLLKPIIDLVVSLGLVEDDSKLEMISARWVTSGEGVEVRLEPATVETES